MSNTSKVLRGDQARQTVSPIEWRDVSSPAPQNPGALARPADAAADPTGAVEREAYQRGFAEGNQVGKNQAAAEVQPVLDRMAHTLADLTSLRSRLRRDAEKDLVQLAIAIARRVLHREVTIDPESIEGIIKVALEKLESREISRVRVHPDQAMFLQGSFTRFHTSKIDLVADPSLRPGDVIFETTQGTLDASIETQLSEIERGFADRLHR
ncbi:MAG TPA: FliH/SctL family protein [Bryobacteraceae bacterium]|nr:FliH/SctL family protein [Bryobacteraceae bacterium]